MIGVTRHAAVLRRLATDEQGVSAVVIGLCMTMLMGFGGLAIDVSLWYKDKSTAQGAADSAAYSAAIDGGSGDTTAGIVATAKAIAAQYGLTDSLGGVTVVVNTPPATGPHADVAGAVEVIVTKPESLLFTGFFIKSAQISARAVATTGSSVSLYCLQSLDSRSSATTTSIADEVTVDVGQCGLQVNGSGSSALHLKGGATLNATTVSVAGNYLVEQSGSIDARAIKESRATTIPDPYAAVSTPTAGACNVSNAVYAQHGTYTLYPGTYCNGLSISDGAAVTMRRGIYIIKAGTFSLASDVSLNASAGVTIVLTGSGSAYATANIGNGATLDLKAPTTGPTAGLAIMQDRDAPIGGSNVLAGGSAMNVTGALYFPRQRVVYSNGASTRSICTQLVAYDLDFRGNSKFGNNCTGTGVLGIGAAKTALVE